MRPVIQPRKPAFSFASVPRHWLGGSAAATHIANGVNLLFPAGERFFVRSVHRFLDRIEDESLRAQVRGFSKQEGHHAQAHERYFETLRAQGYEIDRFLQITDRILYGMIERLSPAQVCLAATAAAEHYTAILAEGALASSLLDVAHPEMRRLLLWHAAEEIEHKSVAFDVLRAVNPSYAVRMAGLLLATVTLTASWIAGAAMLLRQDRISLRDLGRQLAEARRRHPILRKVFVRGLRDYVRPRFHPTDNDNSAVAARHLESM
jgi:uncharacterized protein